MKTTLETLDCGHAESEHSEITRGYGIDAQGRKNCYACCAEADKKAMRETGKACLYLTTKTPTIVNGRLQFGMYGDCEISNWPGSLKLKGRFCLGRHNMARSRYDVWFTFEGQNWHGVTCGENTQICHCRRVR